jgi:hypothetical protein
MSPASAIILGVTFEENGGVGNGAFIDEFYNGGIDSQGNSGPNLGLQFAGTSMAAVDSDVLGFGEFVNNFANEPSPDTVMYYARNPKGSPDGFGVVNFAAGFDVGISFLYSQKLQESTVQVFSGLNGTGLELASLTLFDNWMDDGCTGDPNGPFCHWDVASLSFDGVAQSIVLSGAAGKVLFDNLTLGSLEPVPLPAAVWLLGSGLLGFAAVRRRRQVAA